MNNKKTPGELPAREIPLFMRKLSGSVPGINEIDLTPWGLASMHIRCGELIATLEELKIKIDELAATGILDMVEDGMSDLVNAGIVELVRPVEAETEAKK